VNQNNWFAGPVIFIVEINVSRIFFSNSYKRHNGSSYVR
jgi:hypothetical protein